MAVSAALLDPDPAHARRRLRPYLADPAVRYNDGLFALVTGDWRAGWAAYEARADVPHLRPLLGGLYHEEAA